jgi:hypothetical protein
MAYSSNSDGECNPDNNNNNNIIIIIIIIIKKADKGKG